MPTFMPETIDRSVVISGLSPYLQFLVPRLRLYAKLRYQSEDCADLTKIRRA